MIFQREVSGVEHVQLSVFDVALKGPSTLLREDGIIGSPNQQRWRLVIAKVLVPVWILIDVRPIVVEEVELNPMILWPAEKEQVGTPIVRTDLLRVACALTVDPLHSVRGEEICQRRFGFRRYFTASILIFTFNYFITEAFFAR